MVPLRLARWHNGILLKRLRTNPSGIYYSRKIIKSEFWWDKGVRKQFFNGFSRRLLNSTEHVIGEFTDPGFTEIDHLTQCTVNGE